MSAGKDTAHCEQSTANADSAACIVIFITIAWNLWGIKHILYPWKLFTVAMVSIARRRITYKTNGRLTRRSFSTSSHMLLLAAGKWIHTVSLDISDAVTRL